MPSDVRRRLIPWLVLACILGLYVGYSVWLRPTNFFGFTEDECIYFSSAKSLAEGNGYILPFFPGKPAATRYPILYPWLLSWIWKSDPAFPHNLRSAITLSLAFGAGFLVMVFVFLRRLRGLGDSEALLITGFCALHPLVVFYGMNIVSDMPFCAVAFAAMLAADKALRPQASTTSAALCGILAGLSMLLRVFGIALIAGFLIAGIARRAWRQALVFFACSTPFLAALAWRILFATMPAQPVTKEAADTLGWRVTWAYYTSYSAPWRIGVPNSHIFWAMLKNNLGMLVRGPADYFIAPRFVQDTMFGRTLVVVTTALVVAGLVRQARHQEWKPIHYVLPVFCSIILVWNFPEFERFCLPFLPLFAAGLWFEGKHVLAMAWAAFGKASLALEHVVALALILSLTALGTLIGRNYLSGTRKELQVISEYRGSLLAEKREAYQWMLGNTPPDARLISFEDAATYLYTGRVALGSIVFPSLAFYQPEYGDELLMHSADVARAIRADYWIFASDDFMRDSDRGGKNAPKRMHELESVLPLVFASSKGHVRIYALPCINRPDDPSCGPANLVLFPPNIRSSRGRPSEID